MLATLFTGSAWDVSNSTPCVDNQCESLWRRSNPESRGVIPVEEEIVMESHASVWSRSIGFLEVTSRCHIAGDPGGVRRRGEKR